MAVSSAIERGENISERSSASVVLPDEEHPEMATVSTLGVVWLISWPPADGYSFRVSNFSITVAQAEPLSTCSWGRTRGLIEVSLRDSIALDLDLRSIQDRTVYFGTK